MDRDSSSLTFACAQNPQKVQFGVLYVRIAIDPDRSIVSLDDQFLTIRHARSGAQRAYPIEQIRAVVDLTRDGARHLGIEGVRPLRRGPVIGHLVRGSRDTIVNLFPVTERFSTVALVFVAPGWPPPSASISKQPGVKREAPTGLIDALYLDVMDTSGLLTALRSRGVPSTSTVGEALSTTMKTVDDLSEAEAISARRKQRRIRFGWLSMSPWLSMLVGGPAIAGIAAAVDGRWPLTALMIAVGGLFLRSLWGRVHQFADST